MITETIYTCVITCVVYFIALYFAKNKVYFLAWAFVLFSYSLIIRPTLWPVYPFTIVILLYVAIKNRAVISNNIIVKYLIISSIGIVIVCFQLGMMKKDFGIYTMTFNGTQTFYGYLGAYAQSLKSNQTLQEVRKVRAHEITYLFNNHQWKKIDSLCNADLRDQVKNNTRNLFKGLETDIISNTFMPGNFIISNIRGWFFFDKLKNGCLWLSYWQNVLFTGFIAISVGFIIFLRKRIEKKAAIIMLLNWIFASLIICISGISYWQNNRFNIVCTPFALISFALILSSFRKKGITI
ncbi:MAG: hypothetical protein ACLQQ4_06265 [Bacteroidia bacterium]